MLKSRSIAAVTLGLTNFVCWCWGIEVAGVGLCPAGWAEGVWAAIELRLGALFRLFGVEVT